MIWLAVFVAWLQVPDAVLTRHLIELGLVHEGNPIVAPVIGSTWFLVAKPAIALVGALVLAHHANKGDKRAKVLLIAVTTLYVGVVSWGIVLLELA